MPGKSRVHGPDMLSTLARMPNFVAGKSSVEAPLRPSESNPRNRDLVGSVANFNGSLSQAMLAKSCTMSPLVSESAATSSLHHSGKSRVPGKLCVQGPPWHARAHDTELV